ncbi:MAG: hypothetical protein Q3976_04170 [Corynebacterium sp.]|nr:hypothetical protein [Corynebacterium sp.]
MKKLSAIVLAATASTALVLGSTAAVAQEVEPEVPVVATAGAVAEDTVEAPVDDAVVVDAEDSADAVGEAEESTWRDKLAVAWKVVKWIGFGAALLTGGVPGAVAYAPVLSIGS